MSLNKVMLLGRLGRDPELKNLPNGNAVCNMTVATSESWMKDGQKQEKTEWHRVVVYGKVAENCSKYLHKGSQVYLEGKIQTRSWDDQNGGKKYATEVIAQTVQFLDGKPKNDQQGNYQQPAQPQQPRQPQQPQQHNSRPPQEDYTANDIPF